MATIKKMIEIADDAYYAADYEKAGRYYRQVLDVDPDNKHARQQLKKSEINRSSRETRPQDLPVEALQYYKRSRSFITAGSPADLAQAKKLLKKAITIAEDAGVDFADARNLLEGMESAAKAAEYMKKALDELEAQQWGKAEADLREACNLDATDEVAKTLLEHLKNLNRAQKLITNLNADERVKVGQSAAMAEIRKIIDMTSQTTALSKLWQEVVSQLRLYNRNSFYPRMAMMSALVTSLILIVLLWYLYLLPRRHVVVDCTAVAPGLTATAVYPVYIAKGDKDVIDLSFTNGSGVDITNDLVFVFEGSAKVKLVPPTDTNRIKFKNLQSKEKKSVTIHFAVDEPFQLISNAGDYLEVSLCAGAGNENEFRIAVSPIYGLRTFILLLWGSVAGWSVALFGDVVASWVKSFFKPAGEPEK